MLTRSYMRATCQIMVQQRARRRRRGGDAAEPCRRRARRAGDRRLPRRRAGRARDVRGDDLAALARRSCRRRRELEAFRAELAAARALPPATSRCCATAPRRHRSDGRAADGRRHDLARRPTTPAAIVAQCPDHRRGVLAAAARRRAARAARRSRPRRELPLHAHRRRRPMPSACAGSRRISTPSSITA